MSLIHTYIDYLYLKKVGMGYVFINIYIYIYMVKKYKIIKNIIFDIIIIGAGITGCYLSNRLSNEFPNKKIFIIEKNNNYK